MAVLGLRFAVEPGIAAHGDGGRREEQEMLWATPASLGGCGGRVLPSSCSALSLCSHCIR